MHTVPQAVLVTSLLLLTGCSAPSSPSAQHLPVEAYLKIGDTKIDLEVARSRRQQALGLMHRDSLAADRGMLFPFHPPQRVEFWMKNVSMPLDLIFVRGDRVQEIVSNFPPCSDDPCPKYSPPMAIDTVIELSGGRAAELGIERGDLLTINFYP